MRDRVDVAVVGVAAMARTLSTARCAERPKSGGGRFRSVEPRAQRGGDLVDRGA